MTFCYLSVVFFLEIRGIVKKGQKSKEIAVFFHLYEEEQRGIKYLSETAWDCPYLLESHCIVIRFLR